MKKILSLLTLLMFTVMGAWASTVDDLVAVTAPTTFVMDGLNGTSGLVDKTLYADNQLLSVGGSGYSTSKGKTTYNEVEYTNVYQIKSNRQIALKIGFDAVVTIFGQTNSGRAWQIGTTQAGKEIAAGANGDAVVSGAVDGSVTPQVIYINATSDLYLAGIEIKAAAPVEKTVTFVNDANWENVYAYAWNDDENFTGGAWPGVAMTDTGETEDGHKVYSWATTGDPKWILFNNGSAQTGDCDFVDGGKYNSTGRVIIKNDYTLKFKTEKEWDEVYAYAWNDTENSGWKSAKMTLTDGVYTATVQLENEPTNVLFHNGLEGDDQDKTPDLAYEADKTYEFMKNVYTATFKTDAAWEHVYAYTWTGEGLGIVEELGTWPGKELEAEAGVYNLTISTFGDAPEKIIFNNNDGAQTKDLVFTNGRAYKWITATPIYAMTEGQAAIPAGTVIDVKDAEEDVVATITYGVASGKDFKTPIAYANEDNAGFAYYTEGNGDNGSADGGTLYIINPLYDGNISVGVCLNADKAFYILEDGTAMEGYNGIKVAVKSYVTYEFPVKGGSTYKVYCTGSKLGFYGFDYTGYTKPVPTAEITKVELRGEFSSWGEGPVLTKQGEENVWVGTLDLTTTTSDQAFKLVVNGDQNPGIEWIGWNALTLDDSEGWISGVGGDGSDLKLANSTTGYQTYTVTATWVPNASASANWTLKIEGKDVREDVYYAVGAPEVWGVSWATDEANKLVKGLDGKYSITKTDVELEAGTYDYKIVKNGAWIPEDENGAKHLVIAERGKYSVTMTVDPEDVENYLAEAVKTGEAEDVYYAAGDPTVWGANWTTDEANKLVKGLDGKYSVTKTDVTLEVGTYGYKLVKNGAWIPDDVNGAKQLVIEELGVYSVTMTVDPEDFENYVAVATKTGNVEPAAITSVVFACATDWVADTKVWNNGWNVDLVQSTDNVWAGTLDLTDDDRDVEFKLVVNGGGDESDGWAGWIGNENLAIDAEGLTVYAAQSFTNGNMEMKRSELRYATYALTATWKPSLIYHKNWTLKIEGIGTATGIQNVKADNLKGAEVYNLAGQRMAQPAKGLYIVNGRKVVIK